MKYWLHLHLFFFFFLVSYLVSAENLCKEILEISKKPRKCQCKAEFLEWRKLTTGVNFTQKKTSFSSYPVVIYDWLKVPQVTLLWLDLLSIVVWRKTTLCYVKPQVFSIKLFWVGTTLWWFTLPPVQKTLKQSLTYMGSTKDKSYCTYVI